jgi:putative ABC transport system permease protein
MIRNYLTVAVRSVIRQKGFALINIAGLSIGLACSFFILLWVADEVSFDRFHNDGHRIYKLWRHMITDGAINTWTSHGQPVAETIKAEYPEVEEITWSMLSQQFVVSVDDKNIRETGGYASPAFFGVFSFPFLAGDEKSALVDVNSIVITDRLARVMFGNDWQSRGNILGQTLAIDHRKDFTITGVVADPPANSSIQFNVLLPTRDFTDRYGIADNWYYMCFEVHAKLYEGASMDNFNIKVKDHFLAHDEGKGTELFLQPFEDVHLNSNYRDGQLVGGRIEYVRIFTAVAAFLLLIACINFMNLATARSIRRAREIGVRKVVGAQRRALVTQFMAESIAMTLASVVVALGMFILLLPAFNELTGKSLGVENLNIPIMIAVVLVVGVLAGSYPALYLSGFNPVAALKSRVRPGSGSATFRKGLVVFQFAISVLMTVATVGVYLQLNHIRTLNLGLDREGLVFVPREGELGKRFETVAQELLRQTGIASVTSSGQNPLNIGNNTTGVDWQGKTAGTSPIFFIVNASHDYVQTMGMELAAGSDFSRMQADTLRFIVNEEAAALLGGDVLGSRIKVYGDEGEIVGIVKNFSMKSLYSSVDPTIIQFKPQWAGRIYVRTKPGQIQEALAGLKTVCEQFNPGYPFEYTFLDQVFEQTYRSETVLGQLANIFAAVSILISSLGLLGLTAFTVEQRTKEVGIRKVLGASASGIATLLSRDFVKLVLIGVAIAIPLAAYVMTDWLQTFTSRVTLSWWFFVAASAAAVLVAIATIGFQAIRAAMANPVDTLRSE